MSKKLIVLVVFSVFLVLAFLFGSSKLKSEIACDENAIKGKVSTFGGAVVNSINPVHLGSVTLCEVIVDIGGRKDIIYSTPEGNYFIFGILVDTKTRLSPTMAKKEEINKVVLNEVQWKKLKSLVDATYGDGPKNVYLFTDPHCPFCKRLEGTLKELADKGLIKIHIILFPVHDSAISVSSAFICQKGSGKDYIDHKFEKYTKPCSEGNKKLEENRRFAQELRITGTPGWILDDGLVRVGALPKEEVERLIKQQQPK